MPIPASGSLVTLMDNLVALEEKIRDSYPELRVYRWEQRNHEYPAIFNTLAPSPLEQKDTATWRDTFFVLARLGVQVTDADEEMAKLELYTDAFRDVVDTALAQPGANLGVYLAKRTGMRPLPMSFNEIRVRGFEFMFECRLDRNLRA